jgi:S1-C subfamily serine protease
MDLLDAAILVAVAVSALHGYKSGVTVQALSLAGFLAGLVVGTLLVIAIAPHVSGQLAKTIVAALVLLVPALAASRAGRVLGTRIRRTVRASRLNKIDTATGAVVSVAATLFVFWLCSSVIVNSPLSTPQVGPGRHSASGLADITSQIDRSGVIGVLNRILPNTPNAFLSIQRFLSNEGFPQVFVNFVPEPGPVVLPNASQLGRVRLADASSTVQVVAVGCDQESEGSGFVAGRGLVVTNAHVVAGASNITVEDRTGSHGATVVLFDPNYDLAVLRTAPLTDPTLPIAPGLVARGTPAAFLGYPGGGPFMTSRAGVVAEFDAFGHDIYGRGTTLRAVYELRASVEPGNSGGPLVDLAGRVIGVVFSRSASNDHVGYALASPGVLSRVGSAAAAARRGATVGTGDCVS